MAFVEATVSADEQTARSRDYPMLIGTNVLERSNVQAEWRTSGSWSAGGDATHSAGPTRLAYDRNGKTQTRASLPSGTVDELSLIFDVDATTADEGVIDFVAILGHNFDLVPNLDFVYVEIDDLSDFSTAIRIAQWSALGIGVTGSRRLWSSSLYASADAGMPTPPPAHARYSNVRYIRLRFEGSANFTSPLPALAELWLGRRRQLAAYPNLSYPMNPRVSGVIDFESDSGSVTRHKLHSGRADRELTFETGGGIIGTVDTAGSLDNWIEDIDSGVKPFLFHEHPAAAGTALYLVQLDPAEYVRTANLGPYDSEVVITMRELPQYVADED